MSLFQRAARRPGRLRNLYPRRLATTAESTGLSSLTEEQAEIQDLARRFTREHIIPVAEEYDRTMEYPWPVIKAAHQVGLLNAHIPEAVSFNVDRDILPARGSHILQPPDSTAGQDSAYSKLAYGCSGIQTAIQANSLAEAPVIIAGSEETKKKYLGRMTEEPLVAGYCVTDTVTGPNGTAKTRAEKKGDKWILDGSGVWITNGSHANWFFVLATSKRFAMPRSSMTAFVVDVNTPGIFFGKKEITMGQRCSDTRMLIFDNIEVPEEVQTKRLPLMHIEALLTKSPSYRMS
ncbi:hypothetical protein M407DRAFT_30443 [Tulasnella calospora MUT 4182]|uniref:Acyl-CoA dehydrogenase/oxidase N-terminal domain-containing protein n=1 Tax=Tulasnella calospora MUT 4182 TaxID=1051891 RepID=A0A0C3Q897_9AGAM|nr:hypothetical protein M407DRAFT_30443 [Tulasnella calospora MUT 4182]